MHIGKGISYNQHFFFSIFLSPPQFRIHGRYQRILRGLDTALGEGGRGHSSSYYCILLPNFKKRYIPVSSVVLSWLKLARNRSYHFSSCLSFLETCLSEPGRLSFPLQSAFEALQVEPVHQR